MFSEVNTEKPTIVKNGIRNLFATLDKAVYMLLGITYQIFFNIASAEIFSSGTITKFAQRIQLIIGVFVMFQLVMTIIRGIINPDSFTDSKSGAGNIVFRIATALVMLTLVIPFNFASVNNEFERKVSNNGLLFGTLYSLQYRILNNNTIGKLIMGTSEDSNYITSSDDSDLVKTSNRFVSSILKGFYRVNLVEDYKTEAGKEPAQIAKNRMCNNDSEFNKAFDKYIKDDVKPNDVIDTVDVKCGFASGKRYGFNYMPLVSLVIGILFTIIILSFCIDIATRAIKLGVLQLLAPIPIISYMDPKGGKDGAFNSWIKMVVSTYLDLFVRVASVYLAIFIIQGMLDNGISMVKGGIIGVFTRIFIYVALFYFAKEAPKFIKQVLGIKDDGGSMFSGLGKVTGLASAAGGTVGSFAASRRASIAADEANGVDPKTWFGKGLNRGKHLLSGITGGAMGAYTGASAALNAKDHQGKAAREAMQKRNANVLNKGLAGSTLYGRTKSTATQMFTGDGSAAATDREIEANKSRIDALKAVKSRVSGEMVKQDWTKGKLGIKDSAGNDIMANYKSFMASYEAAKTAKSGSVTFTDAAGKSQTISMEQAELQKGYLLKNNEDDYLTQHVQGTVVASGGKEDERLMTLLHTANNAGGSSEFTRNADGTITKGKDAKITDRSSVNDAIDNFEDYNAQLTRKNAVNKANDVYSGK